MESKKKIQLKLFTKQTHKIKLWLLKGQGGRWMDKLEG